MTRHIVRHPKDTGAARSAKRHKEHVSTLARKVEAVLAAAERDKAAKLQIALVEATLDGKARILEFKTNLGQIERVEVLPIGSTIRAEWRHWLRWAKYAHRLQLTFWLPRWAKVASYIARHFAALHGAPWIDPPEVNLPAALESEK